MTTAEVETTAADAPIRVRRARSVVVTFDAAGAVATNYLAGTSARLDASAVALLGAAEAWVEPAALLGALGPGLDAPRAARGLVALMDAGLVLVDGTPAAETDARFEREWEWGAVAGLFHFGIKDPQYQGPDRIHAWIAQRVAAAPRVPLWTENASADRVALPAPDAADPLLAVMRARRSDRGFDPARPVPLAALRDALVAGLGVCALAHTPTEGEGPLPLAMTPSGGARNPYEAYVFAARVEGLAPGAYHYAGIDNTLERVGPLARFASLVGDQSWFDDAAVLVVLVANFRRSMWKYPHPGALRVVLIEAGHIAQNMLLCATAHGLAAAPTCALSDRALEHACGLDRVSQGALYVVAMGARGGAPSVGDLRDVAPNPRLAWRTRDE